MLHLNLICFCLLTLMECRASRMDTPGIRQRKAGATASSEPDVGLASLAARRETTQRRTASWQAIVVGLVGFVFVRILLKVLLRFGVTGKIVAMHQQQASSTA